MLYSNILCFFVITLISTNVLAQQNRDDVTLDLKPVTASSQQKPLLNSAIAILEASTYPVADPRGKIIPLQVTLKNNFSMVDTIEKIIPDSKIAESAVLLQSQVKDGKRVERELKSMVLNQGLTVTLSYENFIFIGLKGVKAPLKNGDSFVVKLEFGRAPAAEALVQVIAPAQPPAAPAKAPSPIKAVPVKQQKNENSKDRKDQ